MYVRWQHKALVPGDMSHRAYLIECKRKDGQPRTRVVAYLGSVRDSQVHDEQERLAFRSTARAIVEKHCRNGLQRRKAEAKLAEVCP